MNAPRLKLVFMGTPDFAVPALAALIDAGHEVVCVYSQPPRPSGRGHKERPSPVHAYAEGQGIEVRTPKTLKDADAQAAFAALGADVCVVAAYGLILPEAVLNAPRLGCLNVHASLLPRWRGAAPIQRALLAGDEKTGVTIMQMDKGLDTGDMLASVDVVIDRDMTAQVLHDALAQAGADLMVQTLVRLNAGDITPTPQPESGVCYAEKITPDDARIDWAQSATHIQRQVRAMHPRAWCDLDGERLRVLAVQETIGGPSGEPGEVLDGELLVACGEGAVRILTVQRAGKSAMDAGAFLRGRPVAPKTRLN